MTEFIFDGKAFHYPEKILNETVIGVIDLDEAPIRSAWYLHIDDLKKMMKLILEGPHDEVDWMKAETSECLRAYNGFFTFIGSKAKPSANS